MPLRPTFDQIAYTPDLGERLTPEQAEILMVRVLAPAEALARRVADSLQQRWRSVAYPEQPFSPWSIEELLRYTNRATRPDEATIGTLRWHHPMMGAPASMPILWEWETEVVRVAWWILDNPPIWDR